DRVIDEADPPRDDRQFLARGGLLFFSHLAQPVLEVAPAVDRAPEPDVERGDHRSDRRQQEYRGDGELDHREHLGDVVNHLWATIAIARLPRATRTLTRPVVEP